MSNVASDQFEFVSISELYRLKLEEKPQKTTTTTTTTQTLGNADFISNLTDSLLCHILSFLPTKASVATSTLSRRWRHLWKDVQVLDLADDLALAEHFYIPPSPTSKEKAKYSFVRSVNTGIAKVSQIQKFRLSCDVFDRNVVTSWIEKVTGPHLQELYLKLWCQGDFKLPCSVFTCASLVSLTLAFDIMLNDLPHVHLPSLKFLKLERVYHVKFDKLLSGCPVLETLVAILPLCWTCEEVPQAIRIPHSLKSLTLCSNDRRGEIIEHLEIDAPSLEYLRIGLEACHLGVSVSSFPNIMEACLEIRAAENNVKVGWVPEILKALCKTRSLVFTGSTTQFLLSAPALDSQEFGCLLRLQIDFHSFNSKFLVDLLHSCPKLQVLIIHANQKEIDDFLSLKFSEPSGWTQPNSVPNCVISHLNTVEFRGYQDSAEEHEFTAYTLQRGLALKTVTIHPVRSYGQKRKDLILKELSIVPKGSSICQLKLG